MLRAANNTWYLMYCSGSGGPKCDLKIDSIYFLKKRKAWIGHRWLHAKRYLSHAVLHEWKDWQHPLSKRKSRLTFHFTLFESRSFSNQILVLLSYCTGETEGGESLFFHLKGCLHQTRSDHSSRADWFQTEADILYWNNDWKGGYIFPKAPYI